MRAIKRIPLPSRPASWLARQQAQVNADATLVLDARWAARRQTMTGNGVLATLQQMAGYRERCMYCGDSHACDIEHFMPKKQYRGSAFTWSNFLWICQPCNRRKSKKFPLCPLGDALILDPSKVDPWNYFVYIEETGEYAVNPELVGNDVDKATHTVDPKYTRLNIECVAEGRKRDARTLRRAAHRLMGGDGAQDEEAAFIEAATDLDHPELVQWFLLKQGAVSSPFDEVVAIYPQVATNTLQALSYCHPGI